MADENKDNVQEPQSAPNAENAENSEKAAEETAEHGILPENSVKVEDAGTLKKKVTVTVPAKAIADKRDEMFGELSSSALVPGFRIGHAPRRLIEKRFGREIGTDVRNSLVGTTLGEAIKQAKLNVLGEPDIDLDKIELPDSGDLEYSFQVEVAPDFTLPELKGIAVEKPVVQVNDAQVEEQIQRFRQIQARYEETTEPAGDGDGVTADVKIAGEGIDEVHHKQMQLRVAPGQVEGIPLVDLGKALAGKKAGETASLTVKVPQAHPNETWRDKQATIELTVTQVRRRVLPELNDEYAKGLGFDTLAELRDRLSSNATKQAEAEVRRSMRQQVEDYLLKSTQFELPEGVTARHTAQALRRRYIDLLQRGVPREQIDENLTQLQAAASQDAERSLKLSFILSKVVEDRKIEVSEEEINARIAQVAQQYNRRPERMRQELSQEGGLEQIGVSIAEEKALDQLLEEAKVTEITAEQLAARAKQAEEQAEKEAKKAKKAEKAEPAEKAEKAEKPAAKKAEKDSEKKPEKKAHKADDDADKEKKPAKKKSKKAEE